MTTLRNIFNLLSSRFAKPASGCIVVLCLVLSAACERRPLEELGLSTSIQVKVTTKAIPNVTMGIYNDKIPVPAIHPEVMHVVFYDQFSGGAVTEIYITDRSVAEDGSLIFQDEILINPGTYRMIIHNFGTETTIISNYDSWPMAKAHSTPVSGSALNAYTNTMVKSGVELLATEVVYEPDHLVVHVNENEVIPLHSGDHVIDAEVQTIVDTYYLQIKIDGIEHISSATAYLSGMAGGNRLSTLTPIHNPQSTICFDLQKSDDNGVPVLCNIFNTFGRIPDSTNHLELVFDILTADGRNLRKTIDISDIFKTPEAIGKHWLLVEEPLKIDPPENPGPGSGDGSGGMDPSVKDWEDENHDVII